MKVKLAENYGFCFGVKRAIKIAEQTQNSATYGPLIHNQKEINRLKENFNVSLVDNLDNFKTDDTVIIRTHGIEKQELKQLQDNKINIVDATCPFVTKPQEIVEEMSQKGYDIVIFGDKEHPEIKGVKSYAEGRVFTVLKPDELFGISLHNKIAVVAQTTRKMQNYLEVVGYLIENYQEVRVFNTICNATFENQDAIRELSQETDIMIVIGGKNSSNTRQLLYISEENCKNSYLVEGPEDINPSWFNNKSLCGISAGASTPDWIIQQVKAKIESF